MDIGDVFLLRNYGHSGTEPHYHIVVHKTAANDLVLVYTTTSLEKAKMACRRDELDLPDHMEPETYVEIPAGTCPALPDTCAVDCNKAHVKSEQDCINGPDYKPPKGKVDSAIVTRIRAGMLRSGTVQTITLKALDL